VKAHPFFASINWETLLDQPGPFVPRIENPEDTGTVIASSFSPSLPVLDVSA
jgi:hypothetical protein